MLCGLNQLGHIRTLRATRRKLARGDDHDIILGDKFATNPAARAQDGVVVPPDQSYHLEREVIVLHSSPRTSGIGLNGHEEVEPTTKYICQTNAWYHFFVCGSWVKRARVLAWCQVTTRHRYSSHALLSMHHLYLPTAWSYCTQLHYREPRFNTLRYNGLTFKGCLYDAMRTHVVYQTPYVEQCEAELCFSCIVHELSAFAKRENGSILEAWNTNTRTGK